MSFNKIGEKLKDGLFTLLGIEEAHAYLTPKQIDWAIINNPPEWSNRNSA